MNISDLKKIDVDEIVPGMFVEDVVDNTGKLIMSTNEAIRNQSQIERIKKQGIKSVYINIGKGVGLDPSQKTHKKAPIQDYIFTSPQKKKEEEYRAELQNAIDVHEKTLATTKTELAKIVRGDKVSVDDLHAVTEQIFESIKRNPDAIVSLTRLKRMDEYLYTHSVNVAVLTIAVASRMGFKTDEIISAGVGALLHDIGMLKVPDYILDKPTKLSGGEFSLVKQHAVVGADMVSRMPGISDISQKIVLQHHERHNGSGYPLGLHGERIHDLGIVCAISDVYDALVTERAYKPAITPQKSLAVIYQTRESDYKGEIVNLFAKYVGIYPVGSFVELKGGIKGVVVYFDKETLLAPKIIQIFDSNGNKTNGPEIDLWEMQQINGNAYKIERSLTPSAYGVDVNKYIIGNGV